MSSSSSSLTPSRPLLIAGIALFVVLTFLRWPEILLQPSFWGEDGWNWWPEAYYYGFRSLFFPHTGYFQTDSRFIGLLASFFPLKDGPLIFAIAAFIFQVLPPAYFLSSRCAALCPSVALRFVICVVICAMPNTMEVYANLTNSQWHLAILSFLIVAASAPRTMGGWIFDCGMLAFGALSGPYAILLLPVAAWVTWFRPDKARLVRFAIVLCGALIQYYSIRQQARGVTTNLGANPIALARLLGGQIVGSTLLGHRRLEWLYALPLWRSNVLPWALTLVASWLAVVASLRFRAVFLYGLFTAGVFAASLICPVSSGDMPAWAGLARPETGVRYFYLPITFWLVVMVSLAFAGPRGWARRVSCMALAACVFIAIPGDWHIPRAVNDHFSTLAEKFETAPDGSHFTFPERPNTTFEVVRCAHRPCIESPRPGW
ncbi:hypothetical protein [Acetobacter conturbans]|uniref:Glycosyltransferase RgtA/B/C/D-like domain-containing protein n=1 Tax=Acetobacter conturbans TaxID=1737472 RepID=A0ABX0K1L0_9PROT|nr:hypothetical protein [Acetobacter conturbans]NHN88701.1 hypothetical protein [Acetobacter conturbans]